MTHHLYDSPCQLCLWVKLLLIVVITGTNPLRQLHLENNQAYVGKKYAADESDCSTIHLPLLFRDHDLGRLTTCKFLRIELNLHLLNANDLIGRVTRSFGIWNHCLVPLFKVGTVVYFELKRNAHSILDLVCVRLVDEKNLCLMYSLVPQA